MKSLLHWKKRAFASTCRIFSGEKNLGELSNQTFKRTAHGRIRNNHYRFRTDGIFRQETRIIDGSNDLVIGTISYNSMMSKATIQFADRTIRWKYDNAWQTRWSLSDDQGILMKFTGGFSRGTVEYEMEEDLLVLTGIFVTNYYQQAMIAIFVAVFIPIWVTLFT